MSESDFPKRFDPFATREISAEEEEYWKEEYPDDEAFLKRTSVNCSSCGKDVRKTIINDRKLFIHPALEVIICSNCEEFYNDGEFSVDEDGSDKYCRWCGQGGELYCCSECSVAICSKCVKRNLSKKDAKKIEHDDWKCFVCDPKPIWSFRAVCHAAKQYVENSKPSKASKRSRRNIESDSDSDSAPRSTRKRSRRDVPNGKENKDEDESEDLENSDSEEPKKNTKVSKKRSQTSDSDEVFSSRTTKKRGAKSRSRKSSTPSPKKKASSRSSRVITNSGGESSSTSTARPQRNCRTNVESNDSSASPPRKRGVRSSTSSAQSVSKRRSQNNVPTQLPVKKERSLLELALVDVNKDFRQYSKIVAKMQNECEVKYLKNVKNQNPDRWQNVKDKYISVLNDTVESAIELRDSFLKCLERLEKDEEKLTNGDEVNQESETNGDIPDGDKKADLSTDEANFKKDESIDEETKAAGDIHCDETVLLDLKKEKNDDTMDEMETSTQNEQNTCEKPTEEQVNDNIAEQDEQVEDLPTEKRATELSSLKSSPSLEKSRTSANDSADEMSADASDSVVDTSQKDESIDVNVSQDDVSIDTSKNDESVNTSQKDESVDSTPQKNGHVSETEESDSAVDGDQENVIKAPEFKDNCSVKLSRFVQPANLNSSQISDSGKDATIESESDISGVDALTSDADDGETKKMGKISPKESLVFESTRIDHDDGDIPQSVTLKEKEDEAKKDFLDSNSNSDEEFKTDLNDSSVIGTKGKNRPKKRIFFDSDFDDSDNENKSKDHDQKSNELSNRSTRRRIFDSNAENSEDERNKSNKQMSPAPEKRDSNAEEKVKKDFLDSNSDESHISDSDEGQKNELNESNDVVPSEQSLNLKEEAEAEKSQLAGSSDSGTNDKDLGADHSSAKREEIAMREKVAKKQFLDDSDSDSFAKNGRSDSAKKNSAKKSNNKKGRKNGEEKAKRSILNSSDSDEVEKEIQRLTNLNNLTRKRQRICYSSNEEEEVKPELMETDSISATELSSKASSEKKKRLLKAKTTLEEYLTDNNEEDSSDDELSFSKFKSQMFEKRTSYSTKEDMAKRLLLNSQTTDEGSTDSGDYNFEADEKPKKGTKKTIIDDSDNELKDKSSDDEKKKKKKKKKKSESDDSDDKESKKVKSQWRNDPLLRGKLSITDSSDEDRMIRNARKKYDQKGKKEKDDGSSSSEDIFVSRTKQPSSKKKRFVLHSSNSEEEVEMRTRSSSVSSNEKEDRDKKRKKKTTRRRRRIKNRMSDDSESENELNQTPSSQKGRKNIREIMNERDLDEQTRKTAKEEEARKKRIAERQALFNKVFEVKDTSDQVLKKLVLDYDAEKKKELVSVCPKLLAKLKPHQAQGVKFMWDACFESLKQVEKGKGGGCILAHCMGLGKTLQVITLVHTLLRFEETKVKTILVICPLTTVLNWRAEFEKWLEDLDDYDDYNIYELTKFKNNAVRADHLRHWNKNGGIMILGYEMFRSLVNGKNIKEKVKQQISSALLDPGPDLVICDEGHILKNEKSAISKATMQIKSLRRVVLTGTPLQNNLIEYHCMVQFVKPNLLGNKKEFQNRFVHPITNGQYVDSTAKDVRIMKSRAHVLHRMLDGIVQRFDYNVLKPFLPPKHEFVISVGLSDLQAKLYEYYIEHKSQIAKDAGAMRLFKDYQIMRLIWTHPLAMKLSADRHQKIQDKEESDDSMKNFVVSDSDSEASNSNKSVVTLSSEDDETKKESTRLTRAKKNELGIDLEAAKNSPPEVATQWWNEFVSDEDLEDYKQGPKLMLLFAIIRQCELIGDKVLIFSQSIPSLDMIEHFLTKNDEFSQRLPQDSSFSTTQTDDFVGNWEKNLDYFRMDGQTPNELRAKYCKSFNNPNNTRTRLFLISTKAGGLGINLTAANRVIIFDASWNPSYDIQSIFRVYRFGQNKPCYIYRFLSQGTMEEKIYERQVTKLSVSCRVVDEQQIDRHFSRKDITELYTFNRKSPIMDEVPKLPSDRLMAELLKQYKDVIINCHEHDSLLENIEEEELTEEERKAAWKDYEDEKNRPLSRPAMPNNLMQEMNKAITDQSILQTIRKLHPTATSAQLAGMLGTVRQKLVDYYMSQAKYNPDSNMSTMTDLQNPAADQLKQTLLMNALQNQTPAVPQTNFPFQSNFLPAPNYVPQPQPNFVPQFNFVPQANPRPTLVPQANPRPTLIPPANPRPTLIPPANPRPTLVSPANPRPTLLQSTINPVNRAKPSTSNVAGKPKSQPSSTITEPPSDPLT